MTGKTVCLIFNFLIQSVLKRAPCKNFARPKSVFNVLWIPTRIWIVDYEV